MPPMLGMLLVGILLRNLSLLSDPTAVEETFSGNLKTLALMVILMKGGLSLDVMEIRRVGWAVIRLAFIPCFVEAGIFAVLSVFLLRLPWIWGLMLGFVIAAVTPAIIVPCLLELKRRRFRVEENNINTMLISASSFDDVVAISAFMVCASVAFSADKPLYLQILQGPIEIAIGFALGVVLGLLLWVTPPVGASGKVSHSARFAMLLFLGVGLVFGLNHLNFSGSGPLSVIVMSITAIKGWREDEFVADSIDKLWFVGEPLLFGLVGRDVNLSLISLDLLWRAGVVILVSLLFRLLAAFLCVAGTGLTLRERVFVCLSWLPKATVQAAIGSYALSLALELGSSEEIVGYAQVLVTVAVLVILTSAPLGSLLMFLTAPILLEKVEVEEPVMSEIEDGVSVDDRRSLRIDKDSTVH